MSDIIKKYSFAASIFAVLILNCNEVSGLVCYDCNSAFDPRCGDSFDPFTLGTVNCSLRDPPAGLEDVEPTLCRVVKSEVFGKKRVVRSCGYIRDLERDDGKCYRSMGTAEVSTTYCSCSQDLCNAAPAHPPPRAFPLSAAIASLALALAAD